MSSKCRVFFTGDKKPGIFLPIFSGNVLRMLSVFLFRLLVVLAGILKSSTEVFIPRDTSHPLPGCNPSLEKNSEALLTATGILGCLKHPQRYICHTNFLEVQKFGHTKVVVQLLLAAGHLISSLPNGAFNSLASCETIPRFGPTMPCSPRNPERQALLEMLCSVVKKTLFDGQLWHDLNTKR